MSDHFIKNIEITTFKCFDHFEASGFKRVNLIGGKNNIGKTAFLEAVYLNIKSFSIISMIPFMMGAYLRRNLLDTYSSVHDGLTQTDRKRQLLERINSYMDFSINSNINKIKFSKENNSLTQHYIFNINENENILSPKEVIENFIFEIPIESDVKKPHMKSIVKSNFIFPSKTLSKDLVGYYQTIQEENRENEVNNYIHQFDSSITKIKFFANGEIKLEKDEKYQKINTFGDGLKAYLTIILSIYHCKDSCLFIDELENGIHYTQFDQLWEIILTASKKVNCQVFATTHSKECIESYGRITKKIAHKDISFITLVKGRKNKITSINYSYDTLQNSLDQDHEVRGW